MIYYHFKSKQRLYVEILRDVFRTIGGRTAAIADSDAPATAKIAGLHRRLQRRWRDARPYMPPMMMREMAEGARPPRRRHAPPDVAALRQPPRASSKQGVREGVFRPANPVLTYFSLISPIIFFRAASPDSRRAWTGTTDRRASRRSTTAVFLAHLTSTNILARPGAASNDRRRRRRRPGARRPAATRPGDHA